MIPTYLICSEVKNHCTVALGGDGGDELFGGYNRHLMIPLILKYTSYLPYKLRENINTYIDQFKPYDKAGSYGIQDGFSVYVNCIKGCYYNVMGFPLSSFFKNYFSTFQFHSLKK